MELLNLINVPKGYKFDVDLNILVPIVGGGQGALTENSEQVDFATFSGETRSPDIGASGPGMVQGISDSGVVKKWRRKIRDETWFHNHERIFPDDSGPWVDDERAKHPEQTSVVAWRCREYETESGNFERWQIQNIKNPHGIYIHKYRDDLYKVVTMVDPVELSLDVDCKKKADKPDDERWYSNLARARIAIEEYALCNPWQYFVTLTIDGEKLSRTDLEQFRKKLTKMIRNLRQHDGTDIQYLFVPELHPQALKDGRTEWHMHGLMNIPNCYLVPFENRKIYGKDGNKFPPRYIREKVIAGETVSYWKQYAHSFGNSVVESVRSGDASARYLMKYVSKEQGKTAQHLEKGQNLYYHSTGLKRAEMQRFDTIKEASECLADIRTHARDGYKICCETCVVEWFTL